MQQMLLSPRMLRRRAYRRGQAYTALYRMEPVWGSTDGAASVMTEILSPRAADMGYVIEKINEAGERTVFIGDGIPVFSDLIREKVTVPYRCAPPWRNRQSAAAVAFLGEKKYLSGVSETADTFAPVLVLLAVLQVIPGVSLLLVILQWKRKRLVMKQSVPWGRRTC